MCYVFYEQVLKTIYSSNTLNTIQPFNLHIHKQYYLKSALIKLHLAVFIWGFTGVLGKFILLNEGLLVWYRLFITLATLVVFFYFTKTNLKVDKKTRTKLLVNGCIVALHWVLFYGSIKYSNVSVGLICLSTISFFTSFLEPIITKTKFSFTSLLLSLIGVAGIALVFHFDNRYRTGIIIGLFSAFFSALFSCYNKKSVATNNTQVVMFYQVLGGFAFLSLVMPFYNYQFPSKSLLPNITDVIGLLALSWICTIVAMWLSLEALKKVTAFTQNLTLNLEPVYGVILAFIFYNEQKDLDNTFYWGMLLIILSVALQMMRIRKDHSSKKLAN